MQENIHISLTAQVVKSEQEYEDNSNTSFVVLSTSDSDTVTPVSTTTGSYTLSGTLLQNNKELAIQTQSFDFDITLVGCEWLANVGVLQEGSKEEHFLTKLLKDGIASLQDEEGGWNNIVQHGLQLTKISATVINVGLNSSLGSSFSIIEPESLIIHVPSTTTSCSYLSPPSEASFTIFATSGEVSLSIDDANLTGVNMISWSTMYHNHQPYMKSP